MNDSVKSLLAAVKETYAGAQRSFVFARLSLKTGLRFDDSGVISESRENAEKLSAAIREVCPKVILPT